MSFVIRFLDAAGRKIKKSNKIEFIAKVIFLLNEGQATQAYCISGKARANLAFYELHLKGNH